MGYRPMRAAGGTERLYCTIAAMTVLRKAESDCAERHFRCGNLFVVHCLNGKRGAEGHCMSRLAAIINSIVLLTEQVSPARRTRKNTAG